MNKKVEASLVEASDATEALLQYLPDISLDERIDVCARLRAVAKNCAAIDELIKDEIKKKLKNKAGTLLGDVFKANLVLVPTTRFDQAAFKDMHAALYEKYLETTDQKRVIFEPR